MVQQKPEPKRRCNNPMCTDPNCKGISTLEGTGDMDSLVGETHAISQKEAIDKISSGNGVMIAAAVKDGPAGLSIEEVVDELVGVATACLKEGTMDEHPHGDEDVFFIDYYVPESGMMIGGPVVGPMLSGMEVVVVSAFLNACRERHGDGIGIASGAHMAFSLNSRNPRHRLIEKMLVSGVNPPPSMIEGLCKKAFVITAEDARNGRKFVAELDWDTGKIVHKKELLIKGSPEDDRDIWMYGSSMFAKPEVTFSRTADKGEVPFSDYFSPASPKGDQRPN